LGIKGMSNRRVKNDIRDATDWPIYCMNRLPEAWIAPPEVRELRELVRLARQAGRAALGVESPGACGAGQRRRGRADDRPIRQAGMHLLETLRLAPAY
jgi:hypothetical protein